VHVNTVISPKLRDRNIEVTEQRRATFQRFSQAFGGLGQSFFISTETPPVDGFVPNSAQLYRPNQQ